jgi:hypothetical protein
MKIYSLFILQEGGVCLYSKSFSDEFKDLQTNLITPFISAILSFSEKVISKKLKVLELSELRFVLRKERDFIFVIFSDSSENLLYINSRLEKIVVLFFQVYNKIVVNGNYEKGFEIINTPDFNNQVESLILGIDEINQMNKYDSYKKIIDYFTNLSSEREIVGFALLTSKGAIIYSSLTDDVFLRAMRELEIRYMSGIFDLPELFYTLTNGQKVCEKVLSYQNFINLLLIVQFTKETSLGMMDYTTETIIEKIKSFF